MAKTRTNNLVGFIWFLSVYEFFTYNSGTVSLQEFTS